MFSLGSNLITRRALNCQADFVLLIFPGGKISICRGPITIPKLGRGWTNTTNIVAEKEKYASCIVQKNSCIRHWRLLEEQNSGELKKLPTPHSQLF